MSIILFCFAMFENLARYAGTFYFQSVAAPEIVAKIYETTALANIAVYFFFLMVPITARSAFHKGKLKLVTFIYRRVFILLFLTLTLLGFLISLFLEIQMPWRMFLLAMSLAWFGAAISLLKAQEKLLHLSMVRVLCGVLFSITLFFASYFELLASQAITCLIIVNFAAAIISEILIGKTPKFKIRFFRLMRWGILILTKYHGLIISAFSFSLILNIDRITMANFSGPLLTTKYAIATTLAAPVIIMGNSFALTYFTSLLRRNPITSILSKLWSINLLTIVASLISLIAYFTISRTGFLSTKLPEFELIALVLVLYALVANYQYVSFSLASKQVNFLFFSPVIFGGMLTFYICKTINIMIFSLYFALICGLIIGILKLLKLQELET